MAKKQKVLSELGYTSKFKDPNQPTRKRVTKPKPGKSQGAGAQGSKK
jgi:hypothetical protein